MLVDKTKVENIFLSTTGVVGDNRNLFDKDSEYSQWVLIAREKEKKERKLRKGN